MDFSTLVYTKNDRRVEIRINRPKRGNAFDDVTARELLKAFTMAREDEDVRLVVFTGTGKCFCAGGDVKAMHQAELQGDLPGFLEDISISINRVVHAMRSMPKPVIGKINGHAAGAGLGLLLGCDITVAVTGANLSAGFTGIGLSPGCSTFFLPRAMGYNRASEFLFTRETLAAKKACELSLLNRVVKPEELDQEVNALAERIESGPKISIAGCKTLLNRSLQNTMMDQMRLEATAIGESGKSYDAKEGIRSFVEKRKPVFEGK